MVIEQTISGLERVFSRQGLNDAQINERLAELNFDAAHAGIRTLPRAIGAEIGTRHQFWNRLSIGIAGWWLELDEELVFVGDAGETEISGESRRIGIEGRAQILSWLWVDADVNFSSGKFVDETEPVSEIHFTPGNPRNIQAGISYQF